MPGLSHSMQMCVALCGCVALFHAARFLRKYIGAILGPVCATKN